MAFYHGTELDEKEAWELLEMVGVYDDLEERYEEINAWTEHFFTDPTIWAGIEYTAGVLVLRKRGTLDHEATYILYEEVSDLLKGKTAGPHFKNLQEKYPWPRSSVVFFDDAD